MTERDWEMVRDGIYVPSSHLANGMAITRHDEAQAALSRLRLREERLEAALSQIASLGPFLSLPNTHPEDVRNPVNVARRALQENEA